MLHSTKNVALFNELIKGYETKSKHTSGLQVPPRPIKTRFCYHLLCIDYLLKHYQAMTGLASHLGLKYPSKKDAQNLMKNGGFLILEMLEFFSGREFDNNLAFIIPSYDYVIYTLEKFNKSAKDGFNLFRNGFINKLKYFREPLYTSQILINCSVLDGRFSLEHFDDNLVKLAKNSLLIKEKKKKNVSFKQAVLSHSDPNSNKDFTCERYYSDLCESMEEFLIDTSETAKTRRIALMAATNSNYTENLNSKMRQIFSYSRTRMKTQLLSSLTVLRSTTPELVTRCLEKAVRETLLKEYSQKRASNEEVSDICKEILSKRPKKD